MTSTADPHELLGSVVGNKYRLVRLIGQGGMGAIFEAQHTGIGKRLAIKVLAPDQARAAKAVERFQREAQAASAVESAHIVQVFDTGITERGQPYIVMELLEGEDLRARIRRLGKLAYPDAVAIATQVLKALVRAHEAQIVHRDLKPDNVFICARDDDPNFVKLVDFGISKVTGDRRPDTLTHKGTILGTVYYMSPEQAQGDVSIDGRADLYSAAVMLFESIAGRPPHTGNTNEAVLVSICTKDPPLLNELEPEVPLPLAQVVARGLARERDERFSTASEFIEALDAAGRGETVLTLTSAGAPSLAPVETARTPLKWLPAAVALGALFGAGVWLFTEGATPSAAPTPEDLTAPLTAASQLPISSAHPVQKRDPSDAGAEPTAAPPPKAALSASASAGRASPKPRSTGATPVKNNQKSSKGVASGLKLNMTEP